METHGRNDGRNDVRQRTCPQYGTCDHPHETISHSVCMYGTPVLVGQSGYSGSAAVGARRQPFLVRANWRVASRLDFQRTRFPFTRDSCCLPGNTIIRLYLEGPRSILSKTFVPITKQDHSYQRVINRQPQPMLALFMAPRTPW